MRQTKLASSLVNFWGNENSNWSIDRSIDRSIDWVIDWCLRNDVILLILTRYQTDTVKHILLTCYNLTSCVRDSVCEDKLRKCSQILVTFLVHVFVLLKVVIVTLPRFTDISVLDAPVIKRSEAIITAFSLVKCLASSDRTIVHCLSISIGDKLPWDTLMLKANAVSQPDFVCLSWGVRI